MRIAICPGSFDPVTKGHLNIIERSCKLFDKVIVLVLINPSKKPMFKSEDRLRHIRAVTANLPNVQVDSYVGLLANYAQNVGACTLVKGLRAVTDFEFEFQQALANKKLNPNLETMFMITDVNYMYLSSSVVKQVASFGGDVKDFIPDEIYDEVTQKIVNEKRSISSEN